EIEVLKVMASVLEVLDAAHTHGVVHRDLKPENLFLARSETAPDAEPQLKVLDFGLARLLQGQSITTHALALRTRSCMWPEQGAGRIDELGGRAAVLTLATTGVRRRSGQGIHEADTAIELVSKMAKLPAPRLHTVAPGASIAFARVIDRALEFRRD